MKHVATAFSQEEWKAIQAYLKKKGLSMYQLLKDAVLEKVERENGGPGPLDQFQ